MSARVPTPLAAAGAIKPRYRTQGEFALPSHIRPFNRNTLIVCLTLLTLAVAAAFTAACGGSGELGEGGDPLSIVAGDAFEIEIYDVKTYQEQNLPDDLRERFETTQEDFQRFGVDFEDVDRFVTVLVDCCAYRKVGRVGDTRLFVFDGRIDLDAIRDKLEEEGFASRMSGEYETWEKQVLNEQFRRLDQFAAAFLTEEGYVLMGDIDAVRETLYEQSRAGSDESDSAMQQVLTRVGDKWKQTGRLDAQTQNTVNTYCASDVRYRMNCRGDRLSHLLCRYADEDRHNDAVSNRRGRPIGVRQPREKLRRVRQVRTR